ncbi:MAG TPA: alpha/beta hydrolase, partial [Vicinamibacterales bacterium]|nr:alpha/beta hydrolase [Vicinamibacterales bacterium]
RVRIAALALALVLGSGGVVGCGGDAPKTEHDQQAQTPPANPVVVGDGKLVPIGGGRTLYIHCMGLGSPTVVLEAGYGGNSDTWSGVQRQLGATTRTCAYDRAGLGNSLPMPGVHDASDEIADLQRLLEHAHIGPPYVLVGHSYGGLLVRLFADAHPSETAGVVLVDAMGRNATRRELAIWPRSHAPARRRDFARPVADGINLQSGEAAAAKIQTLHDTPLVVITAGHQDADLGNFPPRLQRAQERLRTTMQDELAHLSADHVHLVALRSGHFVQRPEPDGQAGVVMRAVRAVIRASRTQTSLPSCPQLFTGSAVACRT